MREHDISGASVNSLPDYVFNILQNDILNGVLRPGEALHENRISEELGVSRTPVREAISKLEREGLIRTIPNKGSVVVGFSQKDIDDIFTIRMCLEALAGKWSAQNITDSEIDSLRSVQELQEYYVSKGDILQAWQLDSNFHDIIYKACRSLVLKNTLSNFHHYSQKARGISLETPGRARISVEEHKRILDAIANRDGNLAEKLSCEHVKNARDNVLAAIERNNRVSGEK